MRVRADDATARERETTKKRRGEEEGPSLLGLESQQCGAPPTRQHKTKTDTCSVEQPPRARTWARRSRCRRLPRGVDRPLPKKAPHSHTVGTCADEGGGRRGGQSVASMTGVVLMRKGTRDHVPGTGKARNGWTPRADRPGWTPDTPPRATDAVLLPPEAAAAAEGRRLLAGGVPPLSPSPRARSVARFVLMSAPRPKQKFGAPPNTNPSHGKDLCLVLVSRNRTTS